jgi:hypothetical protein
VRIDLLPLQPFEGGNDAVFGIAQRPASLSLANAIIAAVPEPIPVPAQCTSPFAGYAGSRPGMKKKPKKERYRLIQAGGCGLPSACPTPLFSPEARASGESGPSLPSRRARASFHFSLVSRLG